MKRKSRVIVAITAFIMICIPLVVYGEVNTKIDEQELHVTFFNLPDGESTLLQTADVDNILINTGSKSSESELLDQLEELQIRTIDTLILTKQTDDYCGNAKRLIERYQIRHTMYAGELSDACKQQVKNTSLTKWKTADILKVNNHLSIKVLMTETNGEMSLGMTHGKNSIMYISNSDIENEEQLLKFNLKPKILKIADYAQGESPSEDFLTETDPHLSIVFHCKKCKPNQGMIERLNESWIDVYQLERVGTTVIRMDLQDYEMLS